MVARLRDLKPKQGIGACRGGCQSPVVDGVNDRPRVREAHPFTRPRPAAGPPGVDQPSPGAVIAHLLGQQFRILCRMPDQKGSSETSAKRRRRFVDTHFSTRDFGGIAADKMVHRLRRGEATDRRQDSKCVARQENNVLWVFADAGLFDPVDKVDGISDPRVLGNRRIVVIHHVRPRVVDDVFQHRTEANRVVDFRFILAAQVDHFGVATPFDVEDPAFAPAVFVVPDQFAMRIGRERRLAGSGQPEEQRHVARVAFVGAAVHAQHTLFGHQVIHHREDPLFHLTGVLRAEDHQFAMLETEVDAGLAGHLRGVGVRRETASVQDHHVGFVEFRQLFHGGPDQHVVHEQCVVSTFSDHPHPQLVFRIPTCEAIEHKQTRPRVEVIDRALAINGERPIGQSNVDIAPPDVFRRIGFVDDPFVLGAATGLVTTACRQGTAGGNHRVLIRDRILVQSSWRRVADHILDLQTIFRQIDRVHTHCKHHG